MLTELKAELNILKDTLKARAKRTITRMLLNTSDFRWGLINNIIQKDTCRVRAKDILILEPMLGKTIKVYNGKTYMALALTKEMLYHYIGEFIQTRKPVKHGHVGIGGVKGSKFKISK